MAENESLDLGQPGAQRWKHLLDAARKKKSPLDIARQVELKLPKALSKAHKEFAECGVPFSEFMATGHQGATGTPVNKLRFLKAYLMQVRELKEVRLGEKLPDRVLRHLVGTCILEQRAPTASYIQLLGRYRDQWMQVARQAESKGYSWTKMIGPVDFIQEGVSRAEA